MPLPLDHTVAVLEGVSEGKPLVYLPCVVQMRKLRPRNAEFIMTQLSCPDQGGGDVFFVGKRAGRVPTPRAHGPGR